MWMFSFTPRPLYPRYPLDMKLGGPQNRSGQWTGEKSYHYKDLNSDPSAVQHVASRYTDWATPAGDTCSNHFALKGQYKWQVHENNWEGSWVACMIHVLFLGDLVSLWPRWGPSGGPILTESSGVMAALSDSQDTIHRTKICCLRQHDPYCYIKKLEFSITFKGQTPDSTYIQVLSVLCYGRVTITNIRNASTECGLLHDASSIVCILTASQNESCKQISVERHNYWWIMNQKVVEGSDKINWILSRHYPEGTEENHHKLPSG
jgi:hypothetical protein